LFNSSHLEFLSRYTPSGVIHASASGSGAEGLHASASAKALIAHMSPAKKQRIINMITFTPYTPKTITTIGAFEKELEEVRKKGFALDKGEFNELLSCVSAPVLLKGRAVAAITLSGIKLEKRLLQPMSKELIVRSRQVAHSLSQGIN
ncbi:hypothetical protein LJB93_03350, partial [Desulfovibrio sp. OttesenSCG-928-F07]|nr:hypothetical protein [Desulfovibrio sp. OttesenSCG-928-F07]